MHGDTLPPVQLTGTIFNYDKACTIGKLMRNAYMQTYSTQFAYTCDSYICSVRIYKRQLWEDGNIWSLTNVSISIVASMAVQLSTLKTSLGLSLILLRNQSSQQLYQSHKINITKLTQPAKIKQSL